MMLAAQLVVGDIVIAAITEEPDISLTGFLQNTFKGQGYRTTVGITSPGIAAAGILNHLADGALATRNIPDATRDIVEQDGG